MPFTSGKRVSTVVGQLSMSKVDPPIMMTVRGVYGGMMGYLIAALVAVVAILAVPMVMLVRRERRRMPPNPEVHRIEAAATRGFHGARRQAHAYQYFADVNGVSALRDRDSRSY
ncbi:hypothetical protein [Streptomyces roseochromogenus]|uniref:hypothetical protein n=1 Tax=Streptomyces roseochromogenus TaxID=285450 RepID=UPI00131A19E7|nr:hypothetical protein [Streptomyces roseochromogenus]